MIWIRSFTILLLVIGGILVESDAVADVPGQHLTSAANRQDRARIRLLASTANHVVLELDVAEFETKPVKIDGQEFVLLSAPGLDDSALPGHPRLPQTGAFIGLPPTGDWSVEVLDIESLITPISGRIAPASAASPALAKPGRAQAFSALQWDGFESIYGTDAWYPSSPVHVENSLLLRDLRVVWLALHPFRYNPVRGQMEQIQRLVVEIRFQNGGQGGPRTTDAWDAILGKAIINYDMAWRWRGARPASIQPAANPPATRAGAFKLDVDADGLHLITFESLEQAGFPVDTMNPETLHLMAGGREVAISVEVGPDGVFSPGDWILFYGQAARGRFTKRNIYWLFQDKVPGLRMMSRSVTPQSPWAPMQTHQITTRFEQDHRYHSLYPEPNGDHWYWDDLGFLQTGCPMAFWKTTFDLPQLWPGGQSVTLRTGLQGYTFGPHSLKAWVNDHYVGDIFWSGPNRVISELTFDAGWLRSDGDQNTNDLLLENGDCPSEPPPQRPLNGMLLSYFEVDHEATYRAVDNMLNFQSEAGVQQYELFGFTTPNLALYDVTDPAVPITLVGAEWASGHLRFQDNATGDRQYMVAAQSSIRFPPVYEDTPSSLTLPSGGAGYLLIGYGPFLAATQPLVDLRTAQGLTVMSVDVQDVYDEFSYGLLDPGAVQSFLAYVAAEWQIVPDYVLLVGDGTIDYHDYLGHGWQSFMPAYPAYVELRLGPDPAETASDNELDPGTELPIFQMGRLPVASVEQVQAVIDKIIRYETAPPPGPWNRRMLFVADDDDEAGAFTEHSDLVYASLSERFVGDRIYLAADPRQSYEYNSNLQDLDGVQAARAAIRERLVEGRLLVTYMGHSSQSQWAHEILLHRDNVPDLQNGNHLPVVLSMTCYTGAFQFPSYDTLDERLLLEPGGGAVAAWGSTGAAVATGHRQLVQGFFDAIQYADVATLGAATYSGLLNLYNEAPANRDLIDTYVLLGDPAMMVNRFTGAVHSSYVPFSSQGQQKRFGASPAVPAGAGGALLSTADAYSSGD